MNAIRYIATFILASAALPAIAAPLPEGTVLTIDPGVNSTTSFACSTGSCFSVAVDGTSFTAYYNLQPGTDGGIVVGKNQIQGVSPAPGELAGFTRVDTVEAPGSMYTTPNAAIGATSDASANIFDDTSCSSSNACVGKTVLGTWNKSGGFGRGSALGTSTTNCTGYPTVYCPGVSKWSISPAGAPGIDGDRYVLEYSVIFPDYLDGRYHHTFRFHLEGTIQLPKVNGVDAAVSMTASPTPATKNATLTYTAIVTNKGNQTATGVILSDTLPLGVNFVSATTSQGSCNGSAVVSCALGDMASGSSVTVTIDVVPTVAGTIVNTVNVSSVDTDVNLTNNSANTSVLVVEPTAAADLVIVGISASPSPAKLNRNLTYTIRVSNYSTDMAYNTVLTSSLPASMSFVSATTTQGTCSGTSTVTCQLGTVPYGAGIKVTIVAKPRVRGTFTSSASVSSTSPEKNPANNSASVSVTVN